MTVLPSPRSGAVACELKIAAEAGAEMLAQGGSAADALIACTLVVGTVCHYHSGICGGGFSLIREPNGSYRSLDFRAEAPKAATPSLYKALFDTCVGGLSVTIPGELRGFEAMHKAYGKLPWSKLFEPSIKLCREGIEVNEDLLNIIENSTKTDGIRVFEPTERHESWIHTSPGLKEWLAPDGKFPELGTKLFRPEFANTLEIIANEGVDAFYDGPIAAAIVEAIGTSSGIMTLEDLKGYKVRENTPLSTVYKGRKVLSTPAPSSGSILLLGLNILSNFTKPHGPASLGDTHRVIETLKMAYANRTELGDPAFVPGMEEKQAAYIDPAHARRLFERISEDKTNPVVHYNTAKLEVFDDHGTSHITAGDSDGLVITMTTSIGLHWGSRVVVPEYGLILNDGMSDFAVKGFSNFTGYEPSPANFIEGGKRTLSSMSPFIIENADGTFAYAGGASGGSRILSCNIQHVRNVLDYGLGPAEALLHPRLHDQLLPSQTLLEPAFSSDVANGLAALGHNVVNIPKATAVGNGIAYSKEKGWEAAGEPRLKDSGGVVWSE
ncbi:hypothetical protein MNV49_004332 [Pseudohyphozyma bogoriensis]|nr:hypothetical protein MNV49_004332 [Pseudohyphozyma bogoriensis]